MSTARAPKKEPLILNRLAAIMKEQRWSNKELAKKLGYDDATVSLWTTNRVQPSVYTLARIALLIGCNLQEFYVDTTRFDQTRKDEYIAKLEIIAQRSKRTGRARMEAKAKATKAAEPQRIPKKRTATTAKKSRKR